MISNITFKLHLDTHVVTQPIKVEHQDKEQLSQTVAQLLGQFSQIGITEHQQDGTLKHFPARRIQHIEVEFPRVTLAGSGEVPKQVRL